MKILGGPVGNAANANFFGGLGTRPFKLYRLACTDFDVNK